MYLLLTKYSIQIFLNTKYLTSRLYLNAFVGTLKLKDIHKPPYENLICLKDIQVTSFRYDLFQLEFEFFSSILKLSNN